MIWERLPKTKFCSMLQLEFGVYDAVGVFNIGRKATVLIYEESGVIPGNYTPRRCSNENKKRLYYSAYKNKPSSKLRRKILRGKKKQRDADDSTKKRTLYAAGSF